MKRSRWHPAIHAAAQWLRVVDYVDSSQIARGVSRVEVRDKYVDSNICVDSGSHNVDSSQITREFFQVNSHTRMEARNTYVDSSMCVDSDSYICWLAFLGWLEYVMRTSMKTWIISRSIIRNRPIDLYSEHCKISRTGPTRTRDFCDWQ